MSKKRKKQQKTKLIEECIDEVVSEDTDIVSRFEELVKECDSFIFMTETVFDLLDTAWLEKGYVVAWYNANSVNESYGFSRNCTDEPLFYVSNTNQNGFSKMICLKAKAKKAYMLYSNVDQVSSNAVEN